MIMHWTSSTMGDMLEGSIKHNRCSHKLNEVREHTRGVLQALHGANAAEGEQAGTTAHYPLQKNLLPASKSTFFVNQPTAP